MSAEKATTSEQIAIGVAHSKLILIVEHVPGQVKIDSTFYHGPLESAPVALEGIVNCIKGTLTYLDIPCENLLIQIKSSIPPGKGLGSSASVAIAVIRSLFAYANVT